MLNMPAGRLVDNAALPGRAEQRQRSRSISATSPPRSCWASRVYAAHRIWAQARPERDELRRDGRRRALSDYLKNGNITHSVNLRMSSPASAPPHLHDPQERPGAISAITGVLTEAHLNIENMVSKSKKDGCLHPAGCDRQCDDRVMSGSGASCAFCNCTFTLPYSAGILHGVGDIIAYERPAGKPTAKDGMGEPVAYRKIPSACVQVRPLSATAFFVVLPKKPNKSAQSPQYCFFAAGFYGKICEKSKRGASADAAQCAEAVLAIHDLPGFGRGGAIGHRTGAFGAGGAGGRVAHGGAVHHTGWAGCPARLADPAYGPAALAHYHRLGSSSTASTQVIWLMPRRASWCSRPLHCGPARLKVVDPVLGDGGRLYSGLGADMVPAICTTCAATLI